MNRTRISWLIFTILLGVALPGLLLSQLSASRGAQCTVDGAGGAMYLTVQEAVADTTCLDITVAAGIYAGQINLSRPVTITGAGPDLTIFDGTGVGSAVHVTGNPVTLSGVAIEHGLNHALNVNTTGFLHLQNGAIRNTFVGSDSAGVQNIGTLWLERSAVYSNTAEGRGAGIWNSGVLTISHSLLYDNHAIDNAGGAIIQSAGRIAVFDSRLFGNTADHGAAFYIADGDFFMQRTEVYSNSANQVAGLSLYFGSEGDRAEVHESSFYGNHSTGSASAISLINYNAFTITNSTISSNTALAAAGFYATGTDVYMDHVTVAYNHADSRGGIVAGSASNAFVIRNSLVAHNSSDAGSYPDCWGTFTSLAGNLIGNVGVLDQCIGFGAGDLVGSDSVPIDAGLLPLADNGGGLLTHSLQASSPAIDAVLGACLATDQRGANRPVDGDGDMTALCDSGAYEYLGKLYQVFLPVVTRP